MIRSFLDGLYTFARLSGGGFLIAIFASCCALSLGRDVGLERAARRRFRRLVDGGARVPRLAYTFKVGRGDPGRARRSIGSRPAPTRVETGVPARSTALVAYFACTRSAMTYDSYRFNDMAQGVLARARCGSRSSAIRWA
jgi:hypothetical protein